jgi:hypothetical protein
VCGELRYTLKLPPLFTHACHCLNCQRQTGTAFSITTIVMTEDLVVTRGELRASPVSTRTTRHDCAGCGTTIYLSSMAYPRSVILRPGTLDDARVAAPQAHIWVCRKQAWLTLPDHVPQFERDYLREHAWPAASLARLLERRG